MDENPFQCKIQQLLETHLEAESDTLEALNDLSSYFGTNSFQNRRNLRNKIETRLIGINSEFLQSFKMVKISLDSVCSDINELSKSIEIMKNNIQGSKALTEDLIKKTNCLQDQRNRIMLRQTIADAFIKRFQLTRNEQQLLYDSTSISNAINISNDGNNLDFKNHVYANYSSTEIKKSVAAAAMTIVPEFFAVLDRLEAIRADCRILLQNGYETMANDILDEMNLHEECAMERLYRATQHHCRNIDGGQEMDSLITEAMKRLQERPVLFKYVIDEYAVDRRAVLVAGFIEALMDGGPGGNPKPIEFHAHDPKRYIGDMFAWLHQALSTEKDNLKSLLKQCNQNDLLDQMQTALSYIADGISHFLRVRVEKVLNTEKDTIVLFAIANLLRFYQQIMRQVVQSGSLELCLIELEKSSEQIFLNSLATQVRFILHGSEGGGVSASGQGSAGGSLNINEIPTRDLTPPANLSRLLNLLKEILSVATMVNGRQSDIMKIIAHIIDPLLESVQESATHLPTIDMSVYLLNCLYQMQTTLTVYEYMDERIERLQGQMDAQIDTLTSEQATSLVTNLQLNPIYNILQSQQTQIEINLLKIFISKLEAFLEMPEILLLPQIQLITSSGHRNTVQKRSFQVILTIYKQIYERVHNPANGFVSPESIFARTPEEVAKLLVI